MRILLQLLLGLPLSLYCATCIPSASAPDRALPSVTGVLVVDDMAEDAILVNARGQVDLLRDRQPTAQIPRCWRNVGHEGAEPGDEADRGDYVEFSFDKADTGAYTLWLRPRKARGVEVYCDRYRDGSHEPCTTTAGSVPLVTGAWYRVDLYFGPMPIADSCGVAIGEPARVSLPRRIARLLQQGSR